MHSNALIELARLARQCRSAEAFGALVRGPVRQLVPHASLIASAGSVQADHFKLYFSVPVDHPPAALAALKTSVHLHERRALVRWLSDGNPLVIEWLPDTAMLSPLEVQEILRFDLCRVAFHGVLDLHRRSGTYFSFSGVTADAAAADVHERLDAVVPYLNQALLGAYHARPRASMRGLSLTATERELLQGVAAGRTNAEIAQARSRSASTVSNQLARLYQKLGARNRVELLRAAAQQGISGVHHSIQK